MFLDFFTSKNAISDSEGSNAIVTRNSIPEDTPHLSHKIIPISVNYFPHRKCNYECKFCFHTDKSSVTVPLEEAKQGLRLLAEAGMQKINISGGEPFLNPKFLGEIIKYCKADLKLQSTGIICNGSKVTLGWLENYGKYLDIMGVSCDSFDDETNFKIGRSENGKTVHARKVIQVAEWCRDFKIKFKLNTVVNRYNLEEDMNESIDEIAPFRWKVFQVLLLDGENTGPNALRNADDLVISGEEFQRFLDRHQRQKDIGRLVPEDNEAMENSYLCLDEEMRFLNCQGGKKIPGRSILKVGVDLALEDAGWEEDVFVERGGIFDWERPRSADELEW